MDGALIMVEGGSVSVVVVSEMMFIVDAIFWLGICTLEFEVETLEEVVWKLEVWDSVGLKVQLLSWKFSH